MAITNLGQRAVGFLRNLLLCRLLNETELGLWAMASSFLIFAAPLAVLGLPGSFGRYVFHLQERGQLRAFLKQTLGASAVGVVLLTLVMLAAPTAFGSWIFGADVGVGPVAVLAIALLSVVIFNTLQELLIGLKQATAVSQMQLVSSLSFSVAGVGALWFGGGFQSIIAVYAATMALGLWPGLLRLRRFREMLRPTDPLEAGFFRRRVLPFAAAVWLTDLLMNAFELVDRYMLLHLSGEGGREAAAAVGQFHATRLLPVLFLSLAGVLAGMLLPYWSGDWEAGRRRAAVESFLRGVSVVVISFWALTLGVLMTSDVLYGWLLAGRYEVAEAALPLAMIHCLYAAVSLLALMFLRCQEANRYGTLVLAAALGVNIVANAWAVPLWGVAGAVVATLLSTLLLNVMLLSRCLRRCDVPAAVWVVWAAPLATLVSPAVGLAAWFGAATYVAAYQFGWQPERLWRAAAA